ncbi:MAG: hypothetical protein PHV63_01920 [Candidatus Daviesbacteria bacterium]|nr:hypothetical protein [Candidatus Daviesbacteria bacterium]
MTTENIHGNGIRTVTAGCEFWDSLTPQARTNNEPILAGFETYLVSHFPLNHDSPFVYKIGRQAMCLGQNISLRQTDDESCAYIATANGLRVLDEPNINYTKDALKSRLTEIRSRQLGRLVELGDILQPASLLEIFSSGPPYGRFRMEQLKGEARNDLLVPDIMLELLQRFDRGSVGILSWPYSPRYTLAQGITFEHARTLTGFQIRDGRLNINVIDPYERTERPWSFRDLVVAFMFQYTTINNLSANDVNFLAKSVWLIEKTPPSIQTASK